MSEVVFGIRFTVDGKEVTGTARAQADEFRKLGETIQRSNQQGKNAADQFTASLKRQADTLGMTRAQTMAYEASQHQLTSAQRQQVAESIRAIDAHDKQEKMLSRVRVAAAAAGAAVVAFAAVGLRQMISNTIEAEQAGLRLEAVLRATNNAAGLSLRDLNQMAESAKGRTGFDDDEIRKSMAVLLTFKAVTKEHYAETLEMSMNLARVMGGDLQSSVLQLGKALEDPTTGLTALRRSGVSFNETQQEMIKGLVETGRQGEAITLILKTMKEQGLDKVAEAMNRGLYKATNDVKLEWDDMLKAFGRSESVMAPINAALWLVHRNLQIIKEYAEDDSVKGVLGGSGKIRGATPPISPKDFGGMSELDFRLQQLRGQIDYYKGHSRPKGQEGADLQDYVRQLRQQLELTKQSTIEEKVLFDLQEKRWKNATPALREQAKEYSRQLTLREQEAQILAANLRYYEHLASERDRQNDAVNQFNAANTETLQQLDLETKLIGKSREQQELLTGLAKLESEYRKASVGLTGRAAESARELYEQQKRDLEDAIRGKNAAQRIQDQIDETKNAAKQMNEDLQRGLTDSIFRGFEAGKSFARNFRDALVNMFKTTILTPVIKWIVSPVTGAITAALGGLGIPGLANASGGGAGGGLSALGGLGNLSSLGGISDMFGGLVGGANAVFQNLGVGMGSQFLADIGNFGFGVPVLGGITNLLMGNTKGAIGSTVLGILGSMTPLGPIGGAIGSAIGSLIGGGSKGGPASYSGMDISGIASMQGLQSSSWTAHSRNSKTEFGWQTHPHADLGTPIKSIFADMAMIANRLGIDASRLNDLQIPFALRANTFTPGALGPTSDQVLTDFQSQVGQISDQIARELMPNISEFARANETLTQTLVRLAGAREQAKLEEIFGRMGGALQLADQTRDLWLSELSPLTASQRLAEAQGRYSETFAAAQSGDVSALAQLSGISRNYLGEARSYYASSASYTDIFNQVQGQIGNLVEDTLVEQSIAFSEMSISLEDIVANTKNLDTRIAAALEAAIAARSEVDAAAVRAQTEALVRSNENLARTLQSFLDARVLQ